MVLKFKDFVNEEAINENPALAAVATQVASDAIAKKMSEGHGVDEMVEMIKAGKIREARQLLCSQVRPDEMEDVFRWMYDNLELWSSEPEGQDKAILIIRKGLVNHSMVSDPEINLSATLVELAELG